MKRALVLGVSVSLGGSAVVGVVGCGDDASGGAGGSGSQVTSGTTSSSSSTRASTGSSGAGPSGAQSGSSSAGRPFAENPMLAAIPRGEARDLGDYVCAPIPGEGESNCEAITDYSGMAYDARHHRMLMFGGGHATTMTDAIMAFDVGGSLAWSELYPSTPCDVMTNDNVDEARGAWMSGPAGPYPRPISAHTYDFVATSPDLDELVLLGRYFTGGSCSGAGNDHAGPIAHFDFGTAAWTFSDDASTVSFGSDLAGAEYDPVGKKFVALGNTGLRIYDPVARTMIDAGADLPSASGNDVDLNGDLGYANHLVYFSPNDTFYFFARGAPVRTFALVVDRQNPSASTLDEIATSGPTADHQEPGYDHDERNATIGGAVLDGVYHAFDPATSTWTATPILGDVPTTLAFHALEYDPVDGVFVFVTTDRRTFAYRP